MELNSVIFPACCVVKRHGFRPVPYLKLYILTELSVNDVKFKSVDRQKIDLSKCITFGTVNSIFVEIQPDSTNIKNDPRISEINVFAPMYLWNKRICPSVYLE